MKLKAVLLTDCFSIRCFSKKYEFDGPKTIYLVDESQIRTMSFYQINRNMSLLLTAGRRGTSAGLIIAIIAPISVLLLLCVFGYCLLSRRARRKSNAVPLKQENGKGC